jgi:cytochrome c oxidase subunit II
LLDADRRHIQKGLTVKTGGRAIVLAAVAFVSLALLLDTAFAAWPINPRSEAAAAIARLWWLMFVLGTAVFVIVSALAFIAVRRGHQRATNGTTGKMPGNKFVVIGGIIIPAIILTIVFGYTLWVAHGLATVDDAEVTVLVEGRQFWWDVTYPDLDVRTANEIHIPVGVPVDIQLTSTDVIHSFWVPELHGKLDNMPGHTNTLRLEADEPGRYRGFCAEFCGEQHANMHLWVVAQPLDQFENWVEGQREVIVSPEDPLLRRGEEVFFSSACVYCHTIRGTNASGDLGPDLTHLATRQTLAAGILENNRGNLAAWIIDPQAIKPGNLMPGIDLASDDLHALLAYLENLGIGELVAPPTPPEEATPAAVGEATPPALEDATPEAVEEETEFTVDMVDIDYNPNEFTIPANTDVTVYLPNLGDAPHDFNIDELGISSPVIDGGEETSVVINAEPGEYVYYCSVPGHREAGMEGILIVE